jgi:branched-chain amino acid transport system ATP-binding protein
MCAGRTSEMRDVIPKPDAIAAPELLKVQGLHIGYGLTKVIRGLDVTIDAGDRLCVLGGNGSGKSTFLLAVAGLIDFQQGEMVYQGHSLRRVPHHRRYADGIVLIPQNRMLFSNKTIRENLELACLSVGLSRGEINARYERVVETLPFLSKASEKRTGLLSGGEQQIVALGRALMAQPRLLLMDEPTAGLAPVWIEQMELGLQTARENFELTYVLVEQNVRVGLRNTDRLVILRNGCVAYSGECEGMLNEQDLFKTYLG